MDIVANIFVGLVALIHVYILVLEMFLWQTPRARAAFGTTKEFAAESAPLAANQGLYNGFLAAGLVFGLVIGGAAAYPITVFFLVCVVVAGLYGAATANKRILFVQALPAAIALVLVLLAH
jgi:putative membrane protein